MRAPQEQREEMRIRSVEGSIAGVETAGVSFWMDKLESSAQACRRRYLLKAEIENVIESNRYSRGIPGTIKYRVTTHYTNSPAQMIFTGHGTTNFS